MKPARLPNAHTVARVGGGLLTRRTFLGAGVLSAAAMATEAMFLEPRRVSVTHNSVYALRQSGTTVRVAHLSDLHLQAIGRREEQVAAQLQGEKIDAVVITGDTLDAPANMGLLEAFLRMLDVGVPIFLTLGNWEHWSGVDIQVMRRTCLNARAVLLLNDATTLVVRNQTVHIVGLDDFTGGQPSPEKAMKTLPKSANAIVLQHTPVYRDVLVRHLAERSETLRSMACMLSGHTHGGQVALFGWAPLRPSGSGRYVAGLYADTTIPMYVSRGIGTSVLPVRFGSVPELAMLELHL